MLEPTLPALSSVAPPSRGRRPSALRSLVVLGVLVLTVAACRLDVDTRVDVDATGAGTMAITFQLDGELHDTLTATGFDPAPAGVPGWEVATQDTDDGGLQVTVATAFDDPAQLQERVAELQAGLDDEDPRVVESIDLEVADDGASELSARVGMVLPSSTGAAGADVLDREGLVALASDPEAFAATFTVVLPGTVQAANADEVDGRVAVWNLPIDQTIEATATAGAPGAIGSWVVPAIGVAGLVLVVVAGVLVLRRRRRDRRVAPHGRVERLERWPGA